MSTDWQVQELADPEAIRRYLNSDRLYAAYALGDLEPTLFGQSRWWLAERPFLEGLDDWALVLHFSGLTPHAALCIGTPSGVGLLLDQVPLPDTLYLICREEHMHPASQVLDLPDPHFMARMVLQSDRFRPMPTGDAIRLTPDHLDELQALYALDPSAADAFAPYQLADGVFFGIRADGRLASVAGTHLLAPNEHLGAIGNIYTHPDHRKQGYSAACTSAVCAELLARGWTTVLNVRTSNIPAIRLYHKLGFDEYCNYYETIGIKKDKEIRQ